MSKQPELTEIIAPCGLNCGKCLAFEKGAIREHSQAVQKLLGPNFDAYVERFAAAKPVFQDRPGFKRMLAFLREEIACHLKRLNQIGETTFRCRAFEPE